MNPTDTPPALRRLVGALVWALAWLALVLADGRLERAPLSLWLVAGAALASPWWSLPASLAAAAASVAAFNWLFVPPRGSFSVGSTDDLWLLAGLWVVTWVVAALSAAARRQAGRAEDWARRSQTLREWAEAARDTDDPLTLAGRLQQQLDALGGGPATLWLWRASPPPLGEAWGADDARLCRLGEADAEAAAALAHGLRQREAIGPGTGRHQSLGQWVLPLRGRAVVSGAALLRGPAVQRVDDAARLQAQALCDQLGQALERAHARAADQRARDETRDQQARNALLAAISHDYRTPLATIRGAADSLLDQAPQLAPSQREALLHTIRDQATQLARMTDNTLQLARLDAPGLQLRTDWESPEEIIGAALQRARQREAEGQPRARGSASRLQARLEPGLPLLRCDAVLLAQLLDNLVDNALAYSPPDSPVELLARRQGEQLVLAVRDRGPGVPPAWRERLFEPWRRGPAADGAPQGAGVGLAVCRAIAQAHGGQMTLRRRAHGGSAFECRLPLGEPPAWPEAAS
ncbi:DUF4118 domain-containing protein [Ideonella sp. 4Y11]|uniref:histidine kinase n=1 Tax=Ideonella aquatica TaxID=2824119 RepID=A0A941BIF6_9BURK|nr:ATP-binding protein [Ideonella aquatica]MBQ0957793.1 DUF4118 domain-containing protein [Ideonella aquatica]